jgi:hypothetical protein
MTRKLLPLLCILIALPAAASDYSLNISTPFTVYDPGAPARITAYVTGCCRVNDPTQATVTIPLPPGSTDISAPGQFGGWACSADGTTVTCTTFLGATSPYPGIVVDFNVPASADGTGFHGRAKLTTAVADDVPANNVADVSIAAYRIMQVTTADDFGAGSLRDTLAAANAQCDTLACKVTFAGPMTIEPASPLPAITACGLVIDGGIKPGTSLDVPRPVEISGTKAGFANGLEIRSYCDVTLRGITVNGFAANGVVLAEPKVPSPRGQGRLTVEECFIGTNMTATEARPNGMRGIAVETANTDAAILNCTISGNRFSGIAVWASQSVRISTCRIGAGRETKPLGNGASGVYIDGGVVDVGGGGAVAYNHDFGVGVGPHAGNAHVQMQYVFANGAQDFDWGLDGPTHLDPSGRMPPSPVLLAAVYDLARNLTTVYGVIPRPENPPITRFLQVLILDKTGSGYQHRADMFAATQIPGDIPFAINVSGDMRGHTLFAQTDSYFYIDYSPFDTSELSEPLVVH